MQPITFNHYLDHARKLSNMKDMEEMRLMRPSIKFPHLLDESWDLKISVFFPEWDITTEGQFLLFKKKEVTSVG